MILPISPYFLAQNVLKTPNLEALDQNIAVFRGWFHTFYQLIMAQIMCSGTVLIHTEFVGAFGDQFRGHFKAI